MERGDLWRFKVTLPYNEPDSWDRSNFAPPES